MRGCCAIFCLAVVCALSGCESGSGTNTQVVMETSMGTVKIELFDRDAPITVRNFLKYVDDKHYDDTIFHRVMDGFMIQGGHFDKSLAQKSDRQAGIQNEGANGKKNLRGTLAMARTPDPNSATDQFFINVADNAQLDFRRNDAGYAVFGKVTSGMDDVVDKIAKVKVMDVPGFEKVPMQPVIIKSNSPSKPVSHAGFLPASPETPRARQSLCKSPPSPQIPRLFPHVRLAKPPPSGTFRSYQEKKTALGGGTS